MKPTQQVQFGVLCFAQVHKDGAVDPPTPQTERQLLLRQWKLREGGELCQVVETVLGRSGWIEFHLMVRKKLLPFKSLWEWHLRIYLDEKVLRFCFKHPGYLLNYY